MVRSIVAIATILGLAMVAGCSATSAPDALESVAAAPPQPAESIDGISDTGSASALTTEPAGNEGATQVSALASDTRISLAPVVGAPASAVEAMSRRIATRSSERGIAVVPPGTRSATHDMKGYFSAITESGKTTVIYVWDVFDRRGNRLHRIQGQETSPGSSPDGWSSVTARMMEAIGTRTVDEFATWLEGQNRG